MWLLIPSTQQGRCMLLCHKIHLIEWKNPYIGNLKINRSARRTSSSSFIACWGEAIQSTYYACVDHSGSTSGYSHLCEEAAPLTSVVRSLFQLAVGFLVFFLNHDLAFSTHKKHYWFVFYLNMFVSFKKPCW